MELITPVFGKENFEMQCEWEWDYGINIFVLKGVIWR